MTFARWSFHDIKRKMSRLVGNQSNVKECYSSIDSDPIDRPDAPGKRNGPLVVVPRSDLVLDRRRRQAALGPDLAPKQVHLSLEGAGALLLGAQTRLELLGEAEGREGNESEHTFDKLFSRRSEFKKSGQTFCSAVAEYGFLTAKAHIIEIQSSVQMRIT